MYQVMRFVIDCVTPIACFARTCIFQWWGFDMGMASYWSPQESWIPSPRHPRRMQLICVSFPVRAPRGWLRHPCHPFMSSQVNLSYHVLTLMWSWHSSCHLCFSKSLHKGHQHGSWTSDKGGLILVKEIGFDSQGVSQDRLGGPQIQMASQPAISKNIREKWPLDHVLLQEAVSQRVSRAKGRMFGRRHGRSTNKIQ